MSCPCTHRPSGPVLDEIAGAGYGLTLGPAAEAARPRPPILDPRRFGKGLAGHERRRGGAWSPASHSRRSGPALRKRADYRKREPLGERIDDPAPAFAK
jgi:hypothetical protein